MKKSYCTGAPSESLNDCCAQHDRDYSIGSTCTRKEADLKFKKCMESKGRPIKGFIFYTGVRLFGWIFYHDRWIRVKDAVLEFVKRL